MKLYYSPCKNKAEAKKIAKELLKEKLISCANIVPCESIYEWDGELKEESEAILFVKTIDKYEEEVKDKIRELHSYDLPCILKINGRINEEYLSWMESVIQ
ncbi:divalent-cation tolerance protein CutA [Candidatus Woesearchaeota archaeon]|jgi:periplasmic divalent cation tolerance protein|nr:divalent-cation tolerance protein CutA [Candidatus Woesearchaeota archaeon]|tara:strand:- start:516 stop:818 length:303 start_codon:yes stop_codon:yes gene_type:complete